MHVSKCGPAHFEAKHYPCQQRSFSLTPFVGFDNATKLGGRVFFFKGDMSLLWASFWVVEFGDPYQGPTPNGQVITT